MFFVFYDYGDCHDGSHWYGLETYQSLAEARTRVTKLDDASNYGGCAVILQGDYVAESTAD